MLPWIIQMSVMSLILIILVHYLYNFFKNNLTIPKVKDLVNKPQQQYEDILNNINSNININSNTNTNVIKEQSTNETNMKMKDELKNYLKELSNSKINSSDNSINNKHIPINVNDNNGILTGENAMISSFSSNNYSSF